MLCHILEFLSLPAHVCAMACLAGLVARRHAADFSGLEDRKALRGPAHLVGTLCVLTSFLFLPAGSFPAYTEKGASMGWWFAFFAVACTAFACMVFHPAERRNLRFLRAALGDPVFLGVVYTICSAYARQRGFPGSAGYMERFVAIPLCTGATALQGTGVCCLAAASLLYVLAVPAVPCGASFLGSCLALARIRFIVCLFFPVFSFLWPCLEPSAALLVDYTGYWIAVVALLLLPTADRPRVRLLAFGIAATGALLCLL